MPQSASAGRDDLRPLRRLQRDVLKKVSTRAHLGCVDTRETRIHAARVGRRGDRGRGGRPCSLLIHLSPLVEGPTVAREELLVGCQSAAGVAAPLCAEMPLLLPAGGQRRLCSLSRR